MHFSSLPATFVYLGATLLIYYSLGYTFLKKIMKVKLQDYGILVSLPIYLAAGIVVFTFILYPVAMVIFNASVVYIITILVILSFLGSMLFSAKRSDLTSNEMQHGKPCGNKIRRSENIVAGLVFLVSLLYIAAVLAVFEWPPIGDLISHGFFTSLIIYDQKIPATFYPLRDVSFIHPLGFHVNAAFLSLLLGIYPGESVFLFGGVLMIVIVSLVYSLTYMMTHSELLSILSYILAYLAYSPGGRGGNLETWLFGYLFNGPYPNIYGFLIILFSITIMVMYARSKERAMVPRLFLVLMSVILLTYPSFVIVPLMLLIIFSFQVGIRNVLSDCIRTRSDMLITIFLVASFVLTSVYTLFQLVLEQIQLPSRVFAMYKVREGFFLDSVLGYSIIMALIFSFFLIALSYGRMNRLSLSSSESRELVELRPILLVYVLTSLALFVSLIPQAYPLLQYALPSRLTVLIMVLSFVLNVYALSRILGIVVGKLRNSSLKKSLTVNRKNMIVGLTILLFFNSSGLVVYSLQAHTTLQFANNHAWLSHMSSFGDDSKALEWIQSNVKNGELILNDWSWSSLYLLSFSVKNISMTYLLGSSERAGELQQIWLNPDNITLVHSLVKKYNVSYVLVTSEAGFYDFLVDSTYKRKPCLPIECFLMFSTYDFLKLVFRSGSSAIFKIV